MATLERSNSVGISELLSEGVIEPDLEADSRKEVFEKLVDMLYQAGKIDSSEEAMEAITEREEILSTGIGNGVAIPHAKCPSVDSLVAAFGRVKEGVDFKSLDGKPAYLIFLLISPENEAGVHVRALARISRMLKNTEFRNRLLEEDSTTQIIDIIREQEEQQ